MTYKTQTLRVAALMLALVTLTALHATAQTGKIDDDLQRAQAILNDAASAARMIGAGRIAVTAHADRSGSDDYNMGLSRRRDRPML